MTKAIREAMMERVVEGLREVRWVVVERRGESCSFECSSCILSFQFSYNFRVFPATRFKCWFVFMEAFRQ